MKNYTVLISIVVIALALVVGCTIVKVSVNAEKDKKETCIRLVAGKPIVCRVVED